VAITISITSGSGYFGSVYTQTGAASAGQWFADEVAIPGATGNTYTMESKNEGKNISFRQTDPFVKSNSIKMWTPSAAGIASLIADFDASMTDNIVHTGGVVDSVTSRHGTWQLTQATAANKPTYNATGRNGLPVITGDGVSDHFDIVPAGGTVLPVGTNPSTVMCMAHYANQTGDNWRALSVWGSGGTGTSANRNLHKSSGEFVASGGSTSEDCITAVSWPNNDRLVAFEYTSTGKRIFVDGNTTPTTKAVALNTAAATVARLLRGTTDYWRGGFQEYLIFNAVLADSDRQKTEGYLAHKWGKTASLPAGHPYKTSAPLLNTQATVAATGLLPTAEVGVDANPNAPLTISVTSGTGYFGSVYTCAPVANGQWYADSTAIPGATASTYTLDARYEGKKITFRATNGRRSNVIQYWTPDMAPGIIDWWDAARADLLTLVSTKLSAWTSRVSARTLSQSTDSLRPTYSATGRNSKPAMTFDGTDDFLLVDTPSVFPVGTNPSTLAAHAFFANVTTGNWKVLMSWGGGITTRSLAKDSTEFVATGGGSTGTDLRSTVAWTNADRIAITGDTSAGKTLAINGDTPLTKAYALSTPAVGTTYVGRSGAGDYWNGAVQEIIVFGSTLTAADRANLEGYMASKWGTRALLPAGHVYKSSNPPPTGNQINATGLLPTAAASVKLTNKANAALNGLLPTMAGLADSAAPGPITISVTTGTGYAGSIYERDSFAAGHWYVGGVQQATETGQTLTMQPQWEGHQIQFRALNGFRSNVIDLFTPEEIPGLLAWFDAKSPATITHAAGVVSQVSSRRGGWTLTQAVEASKPIYSETGRNGLPAITADGVNDYFNINTVGEGLPPGTEPVTIGAMAAYVGATLSNYRMLIKWGSVSTARRGLAKSNNHFVAAIGGTAGTNHETNQIWDSDRINFVNHQPIGSVINVDGGADDIKVATNDQVNTGDAYIFRDATLYGAFALQEIFLFNRTLTTAERQSLEGYLASRWNQRGRLPVGHPYKNSNPPPKTAYDIPAFGLLPTAAASGVVPFVVETLNAQGYLPTMDALSVSAPSEGDIEAQGYLPTMEAAGQQQTRTWIELAGLLPTAESGATWHYGVSIDWNGYLPTAALNVDFPIRATMDTWGYLAVAEIGGESVYEVDLDATGLLPTAEVDTEVFQFLAMAEVDGYLPTMEAVMAFTPKVTAELESYLPFMQSEVVFPTKVEMDLNGLLPTMLAFAGPVLQPEIEAYGYLPTAEIEASVFAYEITAETVGYLPVSEIGGESVYEVEIDAMGLLPTTEALVNVPERIDATVVAFGLLPTASVEVELRYAANVAGMGYLPTVAAEMGTPPVFVTLELMGYLPRGVGGGGSRPVANAPAAGTANSTLTVGGGPVLSRSAGLRVG
jgi:hypothetical protein